MPTGKCLKCGERAVSVTRRDQKSAKCSACGAKFRVEIDGKRIRLHKTRKLWRNLAGLVLVVIVGVAVGFGITLLLLDSGGLRRDAIDAAQRFISYELAFPESAEWGDARAFEIGGVWEVHGSLTAANAFGARRRLEYDVTLRYLPDEDRFQWIDSQIE